MTTDDVTTELRELRAALAEQQRRIEELEQRGAEGAPGPVTAPASNVAPAPSIARPTPAAAPEVADDEHPSRAIDRRALLGLAGAGIAGAAVLGSAAPAAAADGDNIAIGNYTTTGSANPTMLEHTGAGASVDSNGAFSVYLSNTSNPSNASAGETAGTGAGVFGANYHASSGSGVWAQNGNPSAAAYGNNLGTGPGVKGQSADGIGGVFLSDTGAALQLVPRGSYGPPVSGSWEKGSFIVDAPGNLFVCTSSGTPGSWKKATAASGLTYLPTPVRGYDSRPGQPGPGLKTKLSAGETRSINLWEALAYRTTDVAVLANVTVTSTTGAGFLSVYSGASPDLIPPSFASVNWSGSGQTVGNNVQSAMSGASLKVYASQATHVIIDVVGRVEGDYNTVG